MLQYVASFGPIVLGHRVEAPETVATAIRIGNPASWASADADAAGEGINLQRAHLMVNYDLPWNPMVVEQRIGL